MRDDVPSGVNTFLFVNAQYNCHRTEAGVCDPTDLPQLHGAYFRWRNDND